MLWLIDMACIIISYAFATWLRYSDYMLHVFWSRFPNIEGYGDETEHRLVCVVFLLFCVVYSFLADWNRDFAVRGYIREFFSIVRFITVMLVASSVVIFLFNWGKSVSRLFVGIFVFLDILMTYFSRIIFKDIFRKYISSDNNAVRVVVVAERNLMEDTVRKLIENAGNLGYKIVRAYAAEAKEEGTGVISKESADKSSSESWYIDGIHVHDGITDPFDEVFINTPNIPQKDMKDIIQGFEEMGITTHYNLELPGFGKANTQFDDFLDYSVLTYSMNRTSYKRLFIKRGLDILGGMVGLIITGIVTLFLAPAIMIDSKGPVFFSQTRIGKNGRRFKIYKFRSMYIDAEERKKELADKNEMSGLMFKMKDDPRITKVGAFIRKTSLDELPQFLNILKGEMSLVGTRPPTEEEFKNYNEHYRRRLSMTPGLTGLWQISGRSDITDFDEVVKLDLEYIDNWSLTEDIRIILKTVYVVLFGRGAE